MRYLLILSLFIIGCNQESATPAQVKSLTRDWQSSSRTFDLSVPGRVMIGFSAPGQPLADRCDCEAQILTSTTINVTNCSEIGGYACNMAGLQIYNLSGSSLVLCPPQAACSGDTIGSCGYPAFCQEYL